MDLVELDNQYSVRTAVQERRGTGEAEGRPFHRVPDIHRLGPRISQIFQAAGVPSIAVEIPHSGAAFSGVDNFKAGVLAGKHLLKAAQHWWHAECDEVLLSIWGSLGPILHSEWPVPSHSIRECVRVDAEAPPVCLAPQDPFHPGERPAVGRRDLCMPFVAGSYMRDPPGIAIVDLTANRFGRLVPRRHGEGLLRLALDLLQKEEYSTSNLRSESDAVPL